MKTEIIKNLQRGSMMVEALAMLGLITMVTPILYKKAAERTTELQDINTATQMRTLSKALDDYIYDNYDEIAEGGVGNFTVSSDKVVPYLPYNFNIEDSKLFGAFQFALRNELVNPGLENEHSAITGVVLAPAASELPMIRAAKIASMVGANGGVVDKSRTDNIMGVQGGWKAKLDEFGFANTVANGSLVTASVHAVTSSGGGGASKEDVLFRTNTEGIEYNTMMTTLYMNENPIEDVDKIVASASLGKVTIDGGLDVTDDLTANNATITNALTAGTGTITNLLKAGSANIADKLNVDNSGVKINANTTITGTTTISGGDATINSKVKVASGGLLTATGGAVVSGASGASDTANSQYALVSDGNLLVKNNAHFIGDVKIDSDLLADSLYGNVELGGGKLADGTYNFLATANDVTISQPSFAVSDMLSVSKSGSNGEVAITTNENELKVDSSGLSYSQNGGSSTLNVNSSGVDVNTSGTITMKGGTINASSASMKTSLGGAFTVSDASSNEKLKINSTESVMYGNTATIKGGAGVRTPEVKLSGGDVLITADDAKVVGDTFMVNDTFIMDSDNIVFDSANAALPSNNNARTSGVRIARSGIIDIARGTKNSSDGTAGFVDTSGYIRADRFVSNQAFPSYVGTGGYDTGASKRYDAYQVNPAYTSVMHDIKLTTRGGARLSDILPDFINKGIYVLDNTYKEQDGKKEWEKFVVKVQSGGGFTVAGPDDCDSADADCIASPWLGFVPSPQCPPGYSKVITISPIRWKMAEAFYIPGVNVNPSDTIGKQFRSHFVPRTNPLNAAFELESASGSGSHTHVVKSGWPLTFQTNTWLNTTISGVYGNVGDNATAEGSGADGGQRKSSFIGWHAIMGFLYYASDYKDYLEKVGASYADLSGKVVWNLFPVYNEEMTAIANVYCYFERRKMTTAPAWEWNHEIVDGGQSYKGYDQLTNFRLGFDKNNTDYNKRLNDPVLGYDEVW